MVSFEFIVFDFSMKSIIVEMSLYRMVQYNRIEIKKLRQLKRLRLQYKQTLLFKKVKILINFIQLDLTILFQAIYP
jgi:hypothetical protein